MEAKHLLVGKTISAVYLAEDNKAVKFEVEGEDPIIAKCYGDCCSQTWIENIDGAELIIGKTNTEARNIELPKDPSLDDDDDYGVTQCYGFQIDTPGESLVLDYRNESNGYYGGDLSWPEDYYYGGVDGQNVSNEKWQKIA